MIYPKPHNTPIILLLTALLACTQTSTEPAPTASPPLQEHISPIPLTLEALNDFQWLNKPDSFGVSNDTLRVLTASATDFFNNPEDSSIAATAPFLYGEIDGDFVARALVRPDFSSMWNAVSLMVHIDEKHWIKFAFENSDATGKSIVTVVTKGVSDDANGVILNEHDQVWLKLIRKNNLYAMHWSLDGRDYKMARLTAIPQVDSVKIGVEFQSPLDSIALHEVLHFDLEALTVEDLRKGE